MKESTLNRCKAWVHWNDYEEMIQKGDRTPKDYTLFINGLHSSCSEEMYSKGCERRDYVLCEGIYIKEDQKPKQYP